MEKTIKKLSENILDKFSMDFLRNQVLKNAYGNDDTVIAKLDSRVLIGWYLFFGLVPWFSGNVTFLAGCFALVVVTTILARVAGLVLFLFLLGVFSQTGYLFIVSLFFWWKYRNNHPTISVDFESCNGLTCIYHSILWIGSR